MVMAVSPDRGHFGGVGGTPVHERGLSGVIAAVLAGCARRRPAPILAMLVGA